MTRFDLVHEPWVPVVVDGEASRVSLLEALTDAHRIDGPGLEDPLVAVAVLRQVLLPVYLDAVGVPRSPAAWAERWHRGELDVEKTREYLVEHGALFDLFDPDRPFAQVAGLRTGKDETKPVSLLLANAATGNNVPIFATRTEADPPPLSPAEAAGALLATHCWDTAGIKSGALGDPMVKGGKTMPGPTGPSGQLGVIVPMGRTLAQTLLLNTPVIPQGLRPEDRPQWRAGLATAEWSQRPVLGLLDLLTWQARRVRLVPDKSPDAAVRVRRVVLAAGDRLEKLPVDIEPHSAWRQVKDPRAGGSAQRPIRHEPGRAAWRGMSSLLATGESGSHEVSSSLLLTQLASVRAEGLVPDDVPLQLLTVGVAYGNQSSVVEDVMVDLLPLPVVALQEGEVRDLLQEVVEEAEELRRAANQLGDNLRLAAGGDKLPWDRSQRLGDALVHRFTPLVQRLLVGLQREPHRVDEARTAWREAARRLALEAVEPALAAAPPTAFLGREKRDRTRLVTYRVSVAEVFYRAAVKRILGGSPDLDLPVTPTGARS